MGVPFWNNCLSISGLLSTQEVFQTGVCPKLVPSIRRNSADKTGKEGWHENRETHSHGQFAVGREEARHVTKNLALIQGATISPDKSRGFFCPKEQTDGPSRIRQLCGFSEFVTMRDYAGLCAKITKHQPGKPAIIAAIKKSREHSTEVEETSKKKAECKCRKISGK